MPLQQGQISAQLRISAGILCAALLSGTVDLEAIATAEYDDNAPSEQTRTAPPAVAQPAGKSSSIMETPSDSKDNNTEIAPLEEPAKAAESPGATLPSEQTYSIRLPLGTAGSVLPKLHSPAPSSPPPAAFLPAPAAGEYSHPVAWRATAEAIRNLPAGNSLLVGIVNADFKSTYNSVLQEAQESGWNVTSVSQAAGHVLLSIPKPEAASSDDAAAWLIVVISPIDVASTELRIKIQTRRPVSVAGSVNSFLKRCQMRASGNKLL